MEKYEIVPAKQKEFLTDKECVEILVERVFELISGEVSAQMRMLTPVLNIAKLKISKMDDADASNIVLQVHKISRQIEIETGKFSPFHGDVNSIDSFDQ